MKKRIQRICEAKEFHLLDSSGAIRAMLAVSESDGSPYFSLCDHNSSPRISICLHSSGAHISLLRTDGSTCASMYMQDGAQAGITVRDESGFPAFMTCTQRHQKSPDSQD